MAAALLLRLWDLAARSLWFDEAVEYWVASAPLSSLSLGIATARQPPLYTYVLHWWSRLGHAESWLRLLSVACGVGTVGSGFALARRAYGGRAGAVAALILAVSPAAVKYSQEVGEYALGVWLVALSLLALDRARMAPSLARWGAWGLASALAALTHYGAALVLAPPALAVWVGHARAGRRTAVAGQLAVGVASLIGVGLLVHPYLPGQLLGTAADAAAEPLQMPMAELARLARACGAVVLFLLTGWPYAGLPTAWQIAVPVLLVLATLAAVSRRPGAIGGTPLLWLGLSLAAYYLALRLGWYAYGQPGFRYSLFLSPLLAVVLGGVFAWHERRHPRATWAALALLVGLSLIWLPNRSISQVTRGALAWPETEDVREVVGFWRERRRSPEPTYVYYGAVPAFRYYLLRAGLEQEDLPPGWYASCWVGEAEADFCIADGVVYGAWLRHLSPEARGAAVLSALPDGTGSFWLVTAHTAPDEENQLLAQLSAAYTPAMAFSARGASVYLMERRHEG